MVFAIEHSIPMPPSATTAATAVNHHYTAAAPDEGIHDDIIVDSVGSPRIHGGGNKKRSGYDPINNRQKTMTSSTTSSSSQKSSRRSTGGAPFLGKSGFPSATCSVESFDANDIGDISEIGSHSEDGVQTHSISSSIADHIVEALTGVDEDDGRVADDSNAEEVNLYDYCEDEVEALVTVTQSVDLSLHRTGGHVDEDIPEEMPLVEDESPPPHGHFSHHNPVGASTATAMPEQEEDGEEKNTSAHHQVATGDYDSYDENDAVVAELSPTREENHGDYFSDWNEMSNYPGHYFGSLLQASEPFSAPHNNTTDNEEEDEREGSVMSSVQQDLDASTGHPYLCMIEQQSMVHSHRMERHFEYCSKQTQMQQVSLFDREVMIKALLAEAHRHQTARRKRRGVHAPSTTFLHRRGWRSIAADADRTMTIEGPLSAQRKLSCMCIFNPTRDDAPVQDGGDDERSRRLERQEEVLQLLHHQRILGGNPFFIDPQFLTSSRATDDAAPYDQEMEEEDHLCTTNTVQSEDTVQQHCGFYSSDFAANSASTTYSPWGAQQC